MWHPPYELVCQLSHFGWGMAIVLALSLSFPRWQAFLLLLIWAILKDYGFDILIEGSTFADETIDLIYYLLGGGLALLFLALADMKKQKGKQP